MSKNDKTGIMVPDVQVRAWSASVYRLGERKVSIDGKIVVNKDAHAIADWIKEHVPDA